MASSISIMSTASEDTGLKSIHRSRLSFHFNTWRTRRWLLVQLVSMPANVAEEGVELAPKYSRPVKVEHPGAQRLLDDYRTSQMLRPFV